MNFVLFIFITSIFVWYCTFESCDIVTRLQNKTSAVSHTCTQLTPQTSLNNNNNNKIDISIFTIWLSVWFLYTQISYISYSVQSQQIPLALIDAIYCTFAGKYPVWALKILLAWVSMLTAFSCYTNKCAWNVQLFNNSTFLIIFNIKGSGLHQRRYIQIC